MPEYRPPQRLVPARILTPSGWIRGTFHVARMHSFLDFLSQRAPFFNLTDVALAGSREELPFLALRRSTARLILPSSDERRLMLAADPPNAVERSVTCVLEAGAVGGKLAVPSHLRVSDYLAHHSGFIQLREADLGPARTRVPVLFLNVSALVAVSDAPRIAVADAAPLPAEERPAAVAAVA